MILRILAALPLLLALPTLLLSEEPHPAPLPLCLGAVDGAGVNIHFTNPKWGEMKMLAEGGFRWVRMDFAWGGTERERGRYDFAAYDQLLAALVPHKIGAVFILDYSNRWYDRGLSPSSDEGRQAFARWAAAAAVHFRGRHVLWEMYNEPNIGFWKPKPDVEQYVKLALAVGRALRAAAPGEVYVGPGVSQVDLEFLEACFKAGLLEYWSAVTVHPYRQSPPETAAVEYARLRQLIRRYAPHGARVPILSSEWGYSSSWQDYDAVKQGRHLPRQWLTNLVNEIPLSIWYDWHDDGTDPQDPENRFGTVAHGYFAGRDPVYDPKPAYLAARTLTHALQGFSFSKKLDVGSDEDYALLFANDAGDVRLAAWTMSSMRHAIVIPASPGRFKVTSHTGESLPPVSADANGLRLMIGDAPQYLTAESRNDLWRVAAAWQRAPLELVARAPGRVALSLTLHNPLQRPLRITAAAAPGDDVEPRETFELKPASEVTLRFSRGVTPVESADTFKMRLDVGRLGRIVQSSRIAVDNPLRIMPCMTAGKALLLRMENPSGEAFCGLLRLTDIEGLAPASTENDVSLDAGQSEKIVSLPLKQPAAAGCQFAIWLDEARGRGQRATPRIRLTTLDDFARYTTEGLPKAYRLTPDGDGRVASQQTFSIGVPPEGPPVAGAGCCKITYRFEAGWKFVCLAPQAGAARPLEGRPRAIGMWVYGDGTGNVLRVRVADATGQTFQPSGELMRWKGWRWIQFPLDDSRAGHWGGANDGAVHFPLHFNSLLLIDSTDRKKTEGTVYISSPTLVE